MKTIIFDKNDYKSYKDFYEDIYLKLDGKSNIDFINLKALHYNADILNEFLSYYDDDKNIYIFKNFDVEKIKQQKTYENYEWNLIIEIFVDFAKKYPNNIIEFVNDKVDK